MCAEMEIQGEDVIGMPGQALSFTELRVLVGLADGESPSAIGQAINADKLQIRHLESSIKAKLGAKTHPHMIARGFTLGVLIPRALCLLLAVICAAEHSDDTNRNQTRRGRTAPASRLARVNVSRSSTGGRPQATYTSSAHFVALSLAAVS